MDFLGVLAGGLAMILVANRQSVSLASTMECVVLMRRSHSQVLDLYHLKPRDVTQALTREYQIEGEALKKRLEYSHRYISERASCGEGSMHRRMMRMSERCRGSKAGTMALSAMLDSY